MADNGVGMYTPGKKDLAEKSKRRRKNEESSELMDESRVTTQPRFWDRHRPLTGHGDDAFQKVHRQAVVCNVLLLGPSPRRIVIIIPVELVASTPSP